MIVCPECGWGSDTNQKVTSLRMHIKSTHNALLDCEGSKRNFKNVAELDDWRKNKLVAGTSFKYVVNRSDSVHRTYDCHRSGFSDSKSTGKRAPIGRKSVKLNATCPSQIVAVIAKDGSVIATHFKDHFGHDEKDNIGLVSITPKEKANIAAKLNVRIPKCDIIEALPKGRDADPKRGVTAQTLRNIVKQFDIRTPGEHSNNDFKSSQLVLEMLKLQYAGLAADLCVYYNMTANSVDDAFVIIMLPFQARQLREFGNFVIGIDTTHKVTQYDHYLTSIVVQDQRLEGLPVAFCVSKEKDTLTWVKFFKAIRAVVGDVTCKYFISDGDESFYNAWCTVMPEPTHRRWCIWHVFKNWGRKLMRADRANEIMEILKEIAYIVKKTEFDSRISDFLSSIEESHPEFVSYFRKRFLGIGRTELWAMHALGHCPKTNMALEHLHSELKNLYLERRAATRLDNLINSLVKNANKDLSEDWTNLRNCTVRRQEKVIRSMHTAGTLIGPTFINDKGDGVWEVQSQSDPTSYYIVKLTGTCSYADCLKCRVCFLCRHMGSCTCPIGVTGQLCKHIHAVCMQQPEQLRHARSKIIDELRRMEMDALMPFLELSELKDVDILRSIAEKKLAESGCLGENQEKRFLEAICTFDPNATTPKSLKRPPSNKLMSPQRSKRHKSHEEAAKRIAIVEKAKEVCIGTQHLATPPTKIFAKPQSEINANSLASPSMLRYRKHATRRARMTPRTIIFNEEELNGESYLRYKRNLSDQ